MAGPTRALTITGISAVGLLPAYLVSAMAVQLGDDVQLSHGMLGLAMACFAATSAASAWWSGPFVDRTPGTLILHVATAAAAVALVALGALPTRPGHIVAILAAAGLANGAIQPAANRLIATAVPATRLGLAFGVKQAGIPLAALLAGLSIPTLAVTVGWRWASVAAAILPLAFLGFAPRPSTSIVPLATTERRGHVAPNTDVAGLAAICLGWALVSGAVSSMATFTVASAASLGASPSYVGLLVSVASIASIMSRVALGHAADRLPHRTLRSIRWANLLGVVGLLLMATGSLTLLPVAALLAYGAGWAWGGLLLCCVVRQFPLIPGRSTGMTQIGGGLGACLGPLLFGLLVEQQSFRLAWCAAGGLLLVGGLIVLRALRG